MASLCREGKPLMHFLGRIAMAGTSADRHRVCVVGAGPAGLAMGRALLDAGIAFDIYERNPGVGGIWNPDHKGSPVYQSAHFISSKTAAMSTFRGFPFPDSAPTYPSHRDVRAYLEGFAEKAGLMPHIRLSCGVAHASPIAKGWRVKLANGDVKNYEALVCASGTLWDPTIPKIPGSFSGKIRHSVTYRTSDEVVGKRVLIVGAGNSGVDIACDAARSAKKVLISLRRGYWFVPKFIRGIPTDIFLRSQESLPSWATPPDAANLLELLVGKPTAYGLPEPDHAPFASHPIMNSEILHHIGHGRIGPRGSIVKAVDDEIEFSDDKRDQIDEIILATGYRASIPFLDPQIVSYADGNRPDFWLRMFHRGIPNLYGLGFIETNSSVYRHFDLGAELIAKHIGGRRVGSHGATSLDAMIASGNEPDLTGGVTRLASARHHGYVDSRTYERAMIETTDTYFSSESSR